MKAEPTPLLTCKELAFALRHHVNYVYAMRRRGFRMPADVAPLSSALHWLARNPHPCRRDGLRRSKR